MAERTTFNGHNINQKEYSPPIGKHLKIILDWQCQWIGVDSKIVDYKSDSWFTLHEWNKDTELKFILWVADYLFTNIAAKKELLGASAAGYKECYKAAQQFNMNYGWKTADAVRDLTSGEMRPNRSADHRGN